MIFPLKRIKISGHSMQPTIKVGELFLVNQWIYNFRRPRIGEIVVFKNPQTDTEYLCKRIAAIDELNQSCELRGDNSRDSLDSRQLGAIQTAQIVGEVIM